MRSGDRTDTSATAAAQWVYVGPEDTWACRLLEWYSECTGFVRVASYMQKN
jgi:hypothetical protein